MNPLLGEITLGQGFTVLPQNLAGLSISKDLLSKATLAQQSESHLSTGPAIVSPIGEKNLLMATSTLLDNVDARPVNTCFIKLQQNALLQIQLPVTEAHFRGDPPPLISSLSKSITHRAIDFVTVRGNTGTDGGTEIKRLATENLAHRFNGAPQQASGGATPAEVNDTGNMLFLIVKYHRETVGDKDTDQDIALICDNRVTVDTLKM